ncbi:MAG: glutamate--tRNA ligase, partial [Clostridiales Family XIII bacterium]|nr:glutamate--tRNA ligase [Clostridiales Family XIII bacterium]
EYYRREGYHPQAVLEYLLTIINSNYEEWRAANPDAPIAAFEMTTEKMGVSGILFDLEKLRDVSRETLVRLPAEDLADFLVHWSGMYCEDAHRVLSADRERLARILDIGRAGDKPRKDLSYASQMWEFIRYFYEGFLVQEDPFPDNVPAQDIPVLLEGYLAEYAHTDDRDAWFGKIRALAELNGYAAKPKDFKREPDRYKGHVGDVSTVIRLALTGRASSPDLYEIQQILGDEETRRRVREAAATLSD